MQADAPFDSLIAQGLAASHENRAQAALELFAQASALQPASGLPHFLTGSEHAAAGNVAAAEAALANAVLLSPAFALARYQLGLLQFSSGRAAVALLTWQALLDGPSSGALADFARGFTALAQERFDQALDHFRVGLASPEGNPAVAADIRKVVAAVEGLGQREPQQRELQQQEPTPPATPHPAHVLLAGYGRGLH